jgi:hypothetical protein
MPDVCVDRMLPGWSMSFGCGERCSSLLTTIADVTIQRRQVPRWQMVRPVSKRDEACCRTATRAVDLGKRPVRGAIPEARLPSAQFRTRCTPLPLRMLAPYTMSSSSVPHCRWLNLRVLRLWRIIQATLTLPNEDVVGQSCSNVKTTSRDQCETLECKIDS